MTRLARALVVLTAVPALAVVAAPATAASNPAFAQAEAVPSAAVVQDGAASGRRAAALPAGRSLTVRVSAPATGSRIVLRLRSASGAATQAEVAVDGRRVAAVPVADGWVWRDHAVGSGHGAGAHSVTVTNPAGRRPVLLVDRVSAAAVHPRAVAPAPVDDAYETRIVQLVNAHRAAVRLPRLAVSTCADRFAEDWSATMARTRAFEHRPALRTVMTGCRATAVGENIAAGAVSADQMVGMWMRSPGHRANILSSRFTHIGVAAATVGGRTYGTQNFLRLG